MYKLKTALQLFTAVVRLHITQRQPSAGVWPVQISAPLLGKKEQIINWKEVG